MENEKGHQEDINRENTLRRRTLLKALIGVPVLGGFAYEVWKKTTFDRQKSDRIINELGLQRINDLKTLKTIFSF